MTALLTQHFDTWLIILEALYHNHRVRVMGGNWRACLRRTFSTWRLSTMSCQSAALDSSPQHCWRISLSVSTDIPSRHSHQQTARQPKPPVGLRTKSVCIFFTGQLTRLLSEWQVSQQNSILFNFYHLRHVKCHISWKQFYFYHGLWWNMSFT